ERPPASSRADAAVAGGVLYVVATPIGNLEDVTLRALRVLREVDVVAAEDTRRTRILLQHHGIDRPLTSYHDAVERERTPALVARRGRRPGHGGDDSVAGGRNGARPRRVRPARRWSGRAPRARGGGDAGRPDPGAPRRRRRRPRDRRPPLPRNRPHAPRNLPT